MPLYDYHCEGCDNSFSKVTSYSERNAATCPKCGILAIKKITTGIMPIEVKTTGDRFHGVMTKPGLNEIMEKRARDHYNQEGAAEIREKWGSDVVVEDKDPKKKEVTTK
jgi:putative FmdB family regulatory protein